MSDGPDGRGKRRIAPVDAPVGPVGAHASSARPLHEGARAGRPAPGARPVLVQSFMADEQALLAASTRSVEPEALRCEACEAPVEPEDAHRGLYLWFRGEDMRFDEPALCPSCATAVGLVARRRWEIEEEEG